MDQLFQDLSILKKIQKKLPILFQLAEINHQRNGKLGMEIGSEREKIVIALLIYQFGEENVTTNIPITENETDVIIFKEPISIKTITNKKIVGVKLIWTVDAQKSSEFINTYKAGCDMLFVHINWNGYGGMYLIPKEVQTEILSQYGKEFYFKLPKQGTNPRGVEITNKAINKLTEHNKTKMIKINWFRSENKSYTPYDKWVDLWKDKKDNID
ncbi:MAG: type II restriction endonuclease subunit R [Alphaproteobacteria bacterium]|nr:type II restriction endonuclease subunit R [Alphaproteobacteria bacterium]